MSREYSCPIERFIKDTNQHTMTVIRDDGVNRHLHFRKPRPAGSEYWFDLITWPGTLCIDGDMGAYVFKRSEDMFQFFRADREYMERKGCQLAINPSYWGEKLRAVSTYGKGFKEFDAEVFNSVIMERLVSWIRENREETTADERRDLWDTVVNEIIHADGDSGGYRKQIAAYDFFHRVNDSVGRFQFEDLWASNFERFTFHFIWCCYAIAWGVKTYDEFKGGAA